MAKSKVVRSADMFFQKGTSDKVYHIQVVKEGAGATQLTGYHVHFQYGRRGSNLQEGSKTKAPVSLDEAHEIFEKVVEQKASKGYECM